ncbi:MAG: tRNA (N6-isopentenyl adenosine(37)-C2)-methylthiotransferase MiaB [Lachnospiraceae bacterium]|nr:tRNA (N6-isopentenyl adenosine(37)-C2)-methylthiotransferase MiaB [Lachnospiraceae bacterium]
MLNQEEKLQSEYIDKLKEIVKNKENALSRKLTCQVTTFGCQMNARDSEKLLGILKEAGFEETESDEADFVIYNTCTVRDNANQRVYGRLGALKPIKQRNKDMKIALCGCMTQEQSVIDKLKKSYNFVDLIFGTHNLFCFAELLYRMYTEEKQIVEVWDKTDVIAERLPVDRKYPFKSGINIMFGCNNFCTYCIVPYVRGRERSRKPEEIIEEITKLSADGVNEVMLLGQNVNSYGKNLENPVSFAELLREVEKIDGIKRIRFMTSHPKDLSDELIEVMRDSGKLCKHIHLPLQSGSDRILKAMNRVYNKEQYIDLALKIRKAIPDISITTDIIVGFPGETREDVMETVDVINRVKFDNAFTFIYSKRTGTPAAAMENQVSESEVKENFDIVLTAVQNMAKEQLGRFLGETVEVLCEGLNEQDDSCVDGRMSQNIIVHFKGDESMIGKYFKVRLSDFHGFYYDGEIVE